MVKPFQKPHPPIVVTVVEPSSSSAADAGERGWNMISGNFLLPQWVKTHWERFVEGCGRAGRTPIDPAGASRRRSSSPTTRRPRARTAFGPESPYRFYYKQLGFKLSGPAARTSSSPTRACPTRR